MARATPRAVHHVIFYHRPRGGSGGGRGGGQKRVEGRWKREDREVLAEARRRKNDKERQRQRQRKAKRKKERQKVREKLAAVYYFVCWKAGLLARPGANQRRASMDAQVAGRPILLHRAENMLHRVSSSTSSWHRASPLCFPPWKPFTQPSPRPRFSLSFSSCVCTSVRPSVPPLLPLYTRLWLARAFVLLANHAHRPPRSPLSPFPPLHRRLFPPASRGFFFSFFPFSCGFYGARSSDSRAHLFALIAGHR